MIILSITFLMYLFLRIWFNQRYKKVKPILMTGTRYAVSAPFVRSVSILGIAGIALLIVIMSIMGVYISMEYLAYLLTLGIIAMSVQYFPLLLIGGKGIATLDHFVNWQEIVAVNIYSPSEKSRTKIAVKFKQGDETGDLMLYLNRDEVNDFSSLVKEYTSVIPG